MRHPPASRAPKPRQRGRLLPSLPGLVACALLAGCSAGYVNVPATSPDRIPVLERAVERNPNDVESLVELGAAYREAARPEDARTTLEHARQVAPEEPLPVVLLGLTYEDLEAYTEARTLYQRYLDLVPDSEIEGALKGRIALMRRQEFRALVTGALAREASLDTEPAPTTVAVFPFLFDGEDPNLRPLGPALASMVAADLSQVGRFTLLERMHLDALMAEIELGESDLVDPGTAARSGRLLGAGRVVQGRLGGNEARMDLEAAAVQVAATAPDVSPVTEQDALQRLFDMQKSLVLGLIDDMGITLTTAERERVLTRSTESLQALLAYGRGLEAQQRGAYVEALGHFTEAVEADPDFDEARTEREETEVLVEGAGTGADEVTVGANRDVEVPLPTPGEVFGGPPLVDPPTLTDDPSHPRSDGDPPEVTRDPPEVLGGETVHPNPVVIIDIILRRPGGGGGGR